MRDGGLGMRLGGAGAHPGKDLFRLVAAGGRRRAAPAHSGRWVGGVEGAGEVAQRAAGCLA